MAVGIGDQFTVYDLCRLPDRDAEATLVADSKWFQFVPSNSGVSLK